VAQDVGRDSFREAHQMSGFAADLLRGGHADVFIGLDGRK
jgi:hypothetical protein